MTGLRKFVDFVADLVHLGWLIGTERALNDPVFPNVLESPAALEVRARLAQLNMTGPQALPAPAQQPNPQQPPQLPAPGAAPAPGAPQKRGPGAPTKAEREAKAAAAAAQAQASLQAQAQPTAMCG